MRELREKIREALISALPITVPFIMALGGTIISGRGVAREKEAAFFGITIHAEKEILMLVVEKEIRDQVLHALYKRMGMQQKAQGIVFALPVAEAAGLSAAPKEKT